MVLFIEDNLKKLPKQAFCTAYEQNFKDIIDYVIPIHKCSQPINYFILDKLLEQEFIFYSEFASKSGELREEITVCEELLTKEKIIKAEERTKIDSIIKSLKIIVLSA
jgi:hypothetical protein